jgi:membrane protein YdbS with pleckstrin-like domain
MYKILVWAIGLLVVLFVGNLSYQQEGCAKGVSTIAGVIQLYLLGKAVTLGIMPVRHNRVYYRFQVV